MSIATTSDYQTLCTQIADWANRQDWSPALVASFVAMAEQKFNSDLRVQQMIVQVQNTVTCGCGDLPSDWLEMDMIWLSNEITPTGWMPLRYKARDEFFRIPATPYSGTYLENYNSTYGSYTIEGQTIYFGGWVNEASGTTFKMAYYQEVPAMATTGSSWVYTKYPWLYICAALAHADFHAVGEEDKAMLLGQQADAMIVKLNNNWLRAKASGSRLKRTRVRSFG